jgi:predicted helicase
MLSEVFEKHGEKGIDSHSDFAVSILDPATGTGTFLVEVIDLIYQTLFEKWSKEGLGTSDIAIKWSEYVPMYLLPRLVGYELLMAPYSIAHLKLSLKLLETGYKFREEDRIHVYLTNALSGPKDFSDTLDFAIPALDHEAHAVNEIKLKKKFTVVLGNPPYSGISSNMSPEFSKIIDPYKYVDGEHFREKKHWLQDDYVKFTRLAETQIERAEFGVVGFIMNHAFIDNPTFRGMRWHLLHTFDNLFVLDLHGNVMKQESPPDGMRNENIFDIQQGVAIIILSKLPSSEHETRIFHGDLWGTRAEKYTILKKVLVQELVETELAPESKFYFFHEHNSVLSPEYLQWPQLPEIFDVYAGGFITARDHFVIDRNKDLLLKRIGEFRSEKYSDFEVREKFFKGFGAEKYEDGDTRGWKLSNARTKVRSDKEWKSRIIECLYRPFDNRWIYWTENMVDWTRPETNGHLLHSGNIGLVFMRQVASGSRYTHVMVGRTPVEARACYSNKGGMTLAPLFLYEDSNRRSETLFSDTEEIVSNLKPNFKDKFSHLDLDKESDIDQKIFDYIVGVLNSNTYRERYEALLKIDFPRVPIPKDKSVFSKLSALGARISRLQLLEEKLVPAEMPDYFGSSKTEIERVSWEDDVLWIDSKLRQDSSGAAGFKPVSKEVFEFELGGYKVCEKWFKDRRGCTLTEEEISYVKLMLGSISKLIQCQKLIEDVLLEYGDFPNAFV